MPSVNHNRAARRNGSLCGSSFGCFSEETYILMFDGSAKRINEVRTGDAILADNPLDKTPPIPAIIEVQIMSSANRWVNIHLDYNKDGLPDGLIRATEEHPLFVHSKGWTEACDLKKGDILTDSKSTQIQVNHISFTQEISRSFNIDTDGPNTFFISCDQKHWILAHNAEFDVGPYRPTDQDLTSDGERLIKHHGVVNRWLEQNQPTVYARDNVVGRSFPCISLRRSIHNQITQAELVKWPRNHDMTTVPFSEVHDFCIQQFQKFNIQNSIQKIYWIEVNNWSFKWHIKLCGGK